MFTAGGDTTNSHERAIRLCDEGKIPVINLAGFLFGNGFRELTNDELKQVLQRLMQSARQGDSQAIQLCMEFITFRIQHENRERSTGSFLDDPETLEIVWETVEKQEYRKHNESYGYRLEQILLSLADHDLDRVAKLASWALIHDDFRIVDTCQKVISKLAENCPEKIMAHLGRAFMDADRSYPRFSVGGEYRDLIVAFPPEVVISWITTNGVEAARQIAGHLYPPFVDSEGNTVVSPLTEFLLSEFESDDNVFENFKDGAGNLRFQSGDIAAKYDERVRAAKKFLSHRLRRVREWAQHEISDASLMAESWRQIQEERELL